MPRVKGKVLVSKIVDGKMLAKIQFNESLPKEGEIVTVKWGSTRTLPQNALYWVYLNWLIDHAGLREAGHFFALELHNNLKKHLLATKGQSEDEVTTTDMGKMEFSDYFEKVDKFIQEFFGIDTAPFWEEHKEKYQTA